MKLNKGLLSNTHFLHYKLNKQDMKKLFSLVAVAAAISFASCGGNTKGNTAEEDSLLIDTVAVLDQTTAIENVAEVLTQKLAEKDPAGIQAVVEEVKEQVEALVATGDVEAAAKYASKIQEFVDANKAKLEEISEGKTTIEELINAVKELPTTVEQTTDAAVEAVKADANAAAESVKAAAEQKANEAVEEAQTKANEKIDEAATKAAEKANAAINDAAAKAKSKLGL